MDAWGQGAGLEVIFMLETPGFLAPPAISWREDGGAGRALGGEAPTWGRAPTCISETAWGRLGF